ncbi:fructokinase ScrK [Paucilactobacillus suebicus]|uniref:Fructokinase n=1 Tax=Paucilactobacillus suebicus DSM 5007 = KCTC 3549 TaxID=1423807 RepID=A0A0R1W2B1_9LACO|nr:fructokinase ScrK [Paucilactobacillus suebicus]KRM11701.1 fructokinase [Paucilactobacillus suebicus DSM 5007 = KCTC 3549]
MLLGSIEAGGTKFVCAVGDENFQVINRIEFKTTTPAETLQKAVDYFKQFTELKAISISSFGPIEIIKTSAKYGYITDTPKINWSNTDFLGFMKNNFNMPILWTTDVNGSAYGEYVTANEKIKSLTYYTIGTGVGAGTLINGKFLGETGHPEIGHIRLKRHPDDLNFPGICPYHGDCLEGLVCGPTFQARTGHRGEDVPLSDHVWDIMAYYVAQAALQTTLSILPEKIVFGGGVVSEQFLDKVRYEYNQLMNDYIDVGDLENYITMPTVKNNGSATVGNFALARRKLE